MVATASCVTLRVRVCQAGALPKSCAFLPGSVEELKELAQPFWILASFAWPAVFIQKGCIGAFIGSGETRNWAIAVLVSTLTALTLYVGRVVGYVVFVLTPLPGVDTSCSSTALHTLPPSASCTWCRRMCFSLPRSFCFGEKKRATCITWIRLCSRRYIALMERCQTRRCPRSDGAWFVFVCVCVCVCVSRHQHGLQVAATVRASVLRGMSWCPCVTLLVPGMMDHRLQRMGSRLWSRTCA